MKPYLNLFVLFSLCSSPILASRQYNVGILTTTDSSTYANLTTALNGTNLFSNVRAIPISSSVIPLSTLLQYDTILILFDADVLLPNYGAEQGNVLDQCI